ncbi:MAG: cysteine desulfurase, partial [Lachnospiraceae bacterium]|nr:cysteine desulfurase [Lachnospiraceae bacterium]
MQIYMDHAATTPVRREVVNAMLPYFTDRFGNPSSPYREGTEARQAIDRARNKVAKILDASPEEIFFTGCGTEADNWALVGAAEAGRERGRHIITSSVEHHAVLNTCRYLEQRGYRVTYLPVSEEGVVSVEDLRRALRRDTVLVSIMTANNEVGSIQPIAQLAKAAHERGVLFHTDAVQAFGHIPLSVEKLQIDLLSASGHKFGGPKGVGFLYIRNGVPLEPFLHGG